MSTPSWEHVKKVLHLAMYMGPEQRSRFLDEACCGDADMRAEVESLLAANAEMLPSFLKSAPPGQELTGRASGAEFAGDLAPGQLFEQRFVLVRRLGEGGMGKSSWRNRLLEEQKLRHEIAVTRARLADSKVGGP
jgi:eukaryotic-like serine/threonine-protein kinase